MILGVPLASSHMSEAEMASGPTVADQLADVVGPLFGGSMPIRIGLGTAVRRGPMVLRRRSSRRPTPCDGCSSTPASSASHRVTSPAIWTSRDDLLDGLRRVWENVREGRRSGRPGLTDVMRGARAAQRLGAFGRPPSPPDSQARLRGRLHSLRLDRDAIAHHYDLSNKFYELILDPQMAYSCAYFTSDDPRYTLEDAQRDKLDLVCRKLGLEAGMRMLDVGCAWGSLSQHAAQHHGVDVVGVTLSQQQCRFVQSRIDERGLGERVHVRLQDYRDVSDAPFDAISSIEMGEHVGRRNYASFVSGLRDLLRHEGRLLIQQMSRRSRAGGGPFIEAFIAPDMYMRPVGETWR